MDNEDERKALKDIGIGTPATRASIIETLFKRDYIRREKYAISITRELLDTGIAQEKQPELTCLKCKSRQLLI